ncbi:hypothetical protein NOVOSPHI9U_420341 [Novosphingobium sp. 9U]|nr:hypothetical protein NOVOSPHI9U_420341 [Novosphingobium sp. 9U]
MWSSTDRISQVGCRDGLRKSPYIEKGPVTDACAAYALTRIRFGVWLRGVPGHKRSKTLFAGMSGAPEVPCSPGRLWRITS